MVTAPNLELPITLNLCVALSEYQPIVPDELYLMSTSPTVTFLLFFISTWNRALTPPDTVLSSHPFSCIQKFCNDVSPLLTLKNNSVIDRAPPCVIPVGGVAPVPTENSTGALTITDPCCESKYTLPWPMPGLPPPPNILTSPSAAGDPPESKLVIVV